MDRLRWALLAATTLATHGGWGCHDLDTLRVDERGQLGDPVRRRDADTEVSAIDTDAMASTPAEAMDGRTGDAAVDRGTDGGRKPTDADAPLDVGPVDAGPEPLDPQDAGQEPRPCDGGRPTCDDGQGCTMDVVIGASDSCLACLHIPIVNLADDDECCPPEGNATNDTDCEPACGNGVVEAEESCDGQWGCEDCEFEPPRIVAACIMQLGDNPCSRCQCNLCRSETGGCHRSGEPSKDERCGAVLACTLANPCVGLACYCTDVDACTTADGACAAQIAAAADASVPADVRAISADSGSPWGRAQSLTNCIEMKCTDHCP